LLVFVAPVCAEHLIGYDDTIGDPAALVFGLVVFAPLYGAPALAIRELARRTGGGWPAILLLAAAIGVVQAGLIDQSLFSPDWHGHAPPCS
jgi:hypothetical protein